MTLRAVAQACDVSHNAPYRHFESRDALLAAVAMSDFVALEAGFKAAGASTGQPTSKLMKALRFVLDFNAQHRGRYGLMFSTPSIAAATGELKQTAGRAFQAFVEIVKECQSAGALPQVNEAALSSLLFATMHGLIAVEATRGMHPEKGLSSVASSMSLLLELVNPRKR